MHVYDTPKNLEMTAVFSETPFGVGGGYGVACVSQQDERNFWPACAKGGVTFKPPPPSADVATKIFGDKDVKLRMALKAGSFGVHQGDGARDKQHRNIVVIPALPRLHPLRVFYGRSPNETIHREMMATCSEHKGNGGVSIVLVVKKRRATLVALGLFDFVAYHSDTKQFEFAQKSAPCGAPMAPQSGAGDNNAGGSKEGADPFFFGTPDGWKKITDSEMRRFIPAGTKTGVAITQVLRTGQFVASAVRLNTKFTRNRILLPKNEIIYGWSSQEEANGAIEASHRGNVHIRVIVKHEVGTRLGAATTIYDAGDHVVSLIDPTTRTFTLSRVRPVLSTDTAFVESSQLQGCDKGDDSSSVAAATEGDDSSSVAAATEEPPAKRARLQSFASEIIRAARPANSFAMGGGVALRGNGCAIRTHTKCGTSLDSLYELMMHNMWVELVGAGVVQLHPRTAIVSRGGGSVMDATDTIQYTPDAYRNDADERERAYYEYDGTPMPSDEKRSKCRLFSRQWNTVYLVFGDPNPPFARRYEDRPPMSSGGMRIIKYCNGEEVFEGCFVERDGRISVAKREGEEDFSWDTERLRRAYAKARAVRGV